MHVTIFATVFNYGAIAQLVEQRTENPCVPGSNPGSTTNGTKPLFWFRFYFAISLRTENYLSVLRFFCQKQKALFNKASL